MDQPIETAKAIDNFLEVVEKEQEKKEKAKKKKPIINQEETAQVAFWYEKIRMAIDYKEDHLLRRTASRRILKRLFLLEGRRKEVADLLLKELIMGGYVKKSDLNEKLFKKVDQALNKYAYAISLTYESAIFLDETALGTRRWLVTLASYEVEEILYPSRERKALITAIYNMLSPRITTGRREVSAKQRNIQTYIAIYRSLARADRAMVTSEVFGIYYPQWFENPSTDKVKEIVKNSGAIIKTIQSQAINPLASRIFYSIKRQTLYAHILYEVAMENPGDARGIVSQEYILREFINGKVEEEYERIREKLKKRIRRGIIYIFLTKMLLAIVFEIPFEKYFEGGINYLALGVNIFFPPAFMMFLAMSARFPGKENADAIVDGVLNLVYDDPEKDELTPINVYPRPASGFPQKTLDFLYFVVFSAVFGFFIWLLYTLDFNYVSGAIFLIFMATVSFFGALIRQSVRDLVVIKEKEGIASLLFDTMLLPFVRFGRWLSTNFSKVNVFMFFLDVIIEAPFKMVIRLFESWVNFLRRKREEVDQQFEWD